MVYAFLNDNAPATNPAAYIRAAIYTVANAVHYRMYPSSRGAMILIFDSKELRDALVEVNYASLCPRFIPQLYFYHQTA